jgi:hypothetical protein
MDWLQFTSAVIGSLAWPLAAVGLGFMFREQVRKLLDKMQSLKAPGIEASFSQDVAKIVEEAKQVQTEEAPPAQQGETQFGTPSAIQGPPPKDESDQLYELIKERPAALIVDAWRDIERAMLDVIGAKGVYVPPVETKNPANWPKHLERTGMISPETGALIRELRALRNRVAHARDWEPTVADAIDYYKTATLVRNVLNTKHKEILAGMPNADDE